MGKSINIKTILIAAMLLILALSQLAPISKANAATIQSGNEFFNNQPDYCNDNAGGCDPLVSYGVSSCVLQAAGTASALGQGEFYSNAENGGSATFWNAEQNYNFSGAKNILVTDLLAYYYGVDPSEQNCPIFSSTEGQLSLTTQQQYSLDNIGASFDILEIIYGQNVPSNEFTYHSSGTLGAYVTFKSGVISAFIDDMARSTTLVCPSQVMPELDNTAMDIRSSSYDVGKTNPTASKGMYGIIDDATSTTSCTANPNLYTDLIDIDCGNLSNIPPTFCTSLASCGGGGQTATGTCYISDSDNGNAAVGTPDTMYLNWNLPTQTTNINSVTVTTSTSNNNIAPSNVINGAPPSSVGGYNVTNDPLNPPTDNESTPTTVNYSGSMSVNITGDSPTTQTINCSYPITWSSPPTGPGSNACQQAEAQVITDNTALQNDENTLTNDQTTAAKLSADEQAVKSDTSTDNYDYEVWQAAITADKPPNNTTANNTAVNTAKKTYDNENNTLNTAENTVSNDKTAATNSASGGPDYIAIGNDNTKLADDTSDENLACTTQPTCQQYGEEGTYPNCYVYTAPQCPSGDTGTYPNCIVPVTGGGSPTGPESYFSISGGDTIVGTGFGNGSCTDDLSAGIVASNSGSSSWTGASDNLATLAPDIINGFSTGTGGDTLTFANTTNSPYGGSYGSTDGLCSQDYYSTSANVSGFSSLTAATGTFNLANVGSDSANCLQSNSVYYCKLAGSSAISGSPSVGSKIVLYVNGNAEISSADGSSISIYANDSSPLTSASSIPFLYVISNGNIYIDSGITSIDGVYVADNLSDANQANNGIIFTCANSGSSFTNISNMITSCNNNLTINGALVAGQIKFGRTYGDITTSNGSSVAPSESINYGPEVWLSEIGGSNNLPLNPDFQNITELSPVI